MALCYRAWAEIDLHAFQQNLDWIKFRVGGRKIISVVKADAYGHGLRQIAASLMQFGTDIFGVANLQEAAAIRTVGKGWPILMLGAAMPDEWPQIIKLRVRPTLSSLKEARGFSELATKSNLTLPVHIKVDTGMGRLGFQPSEFLQRYSELAALKGIQIEALYSHFSSAEDDAHFTRQQTTQFHAIIEALRIKDVSIPPLHLANSAGILFEQDSLHDFVRPGLLVYGVIPKGKRNLKSSLAKELLPVLSFKSRVTLVRQLPKGATVSYGHTYRVPKKMTIATLGLGYGDGLPREASNRGSILIRGKSCKILGRVTMDQTLVDASEIESEIQEGDEAVIIGASGDARLDVNDWAETCGTIPWAILTGITYRVPRIYKGGSAS